MLRRLFQKKEHSTVHIQTTLIGNEIERRLEHEKKINHSLMNEVKEKNDRALLLQGQIDDLKLEVKQVQKVVEENQKIIDHNELRLEKECKRADRAIEDVAEHKFEIKQLKGELEKREAIVA